MLLVVFYCVCLRVVTELCVKLLVCGIKEPSPSLRVGVDRIVTVWIAEVLVIGRPMIEATLDWED